MKSVATVKTLEKATFSPESSSRFTGTDLEFLFRKRLAVGFLERHLATELSIEFGQLKRTCVSVNTVVLRPLPDLLQANADTVPPLMAPAIPKQAMVPKVGERFGVLATTRGLSPVTFSTTLATWVLVVL